MTGVTLWAVVGPLVGLFFSPTPVTNTSGAAAYLNVWIDFDRNGSLSDSGEQIAAMYSEDLTRIRLGSMLAAIAFTLMAPFGLPLGVEGKAISLISGGFDYLVRIVVRNLTHFQEVVEGMLDGGLGVAKYVSYIVVKSPPRTNEMEVPARPSNSSSAPATVMLPTHRNPPVTS